MERNADKQHPQAADEAANKARGALAKKAGPETGYGLCQCGCGRQVGIAKHNNRRYGQVKGQPFKVIKGHASRARMRIRTGLVRYRTDPATGCWLWAGPAKDRHPQVSVNGKALKAARYVYEQLRGPIPPKAVLKHVCGRTDCVNPAHKQLLTLTENVGRGKCIKLDWPAVDAIRRETAAGVSKKELAAKYGVAPATVGDVLRGRAWKPASRPAEARA